MNIFIVLSVICYVYACYAFFSGISLAECSIPEELEECYVKNSLQDFHLPMNIRVLLDIIRKAEKYSYTTMDMKTLSSSLMHRFKFDGIEYYTNIQEKDGILPFGQSGKQNFKNKLIKELVPGKPELFPFHALTAIERCTLHQAISNTIIRDSSRGTNSLCQEIGQKLIGKALFADLWNCPREYGVILTPYGTITPGAIIGAIAASLQHQNVALREIIHEITSERPRGTTEDRGLTDATHMEEVDFIIPRSEIIRDRSMSYISSLDPDIKLDNVWLTTVAGELAEMVVYQGPILNSEMEIGATGFWNNTMRPNVYYLKNKIGYFDATRAEIVGDIDGLIIANKVQKWINDFYSLRLSQILDMYYTDEGMSLFNENIKVCNRKKAFSFVAPKILLDEQTYAASHLLAYRNGIIFQSSQVLQKLVDHAVAKFSVYANDHLLMELLCRNRKHYPQLETLIVFDGAWTKEYTMDFIAALIDDLDISMYGSKMGIIHGTSGQWLLNVTNSPSFAYHAVSNFTTISWPKNLNFIAILNTISNYMNETWEAKRQQHIIGGLGQVVVILAPLTEFSEVEQQIILKLLQEIEHLHPDLYFVYYVSESNSRLFQPLILSNQDRLIIGPNIDNLVQYLSTIPRTLRPVVSKRANESSTEYQDKIEDYISPSKSTTYILHPQHMINAETTITVHNFGYGTITACSWNQFDGEELMTCQQLDAHKEISLFDNFKCINTRCPYIYLRVQNATSLIKCAEMECRSPNQVRYIIRMQSTYENSANKKILINVFIMLFLHLQLAVFNV